MGLFKIKLNTSDTCPLIRVGIFLFYPALHLLYIAKGVSTLDWNSIKAEYVTTDISQRSLAQKYGVSPAQVARHSKSEGWVDLRKQRASKTQAKLIDRVIESDVNRLERILIVSDKLLERVEEYIASMPKELFGRDLKNLTGAIKDLKDIQNIQPDEQAITVKFDESLERFAK